MIINIITELKALLANENEYMTKRLDLNVFFHYTLCNQPVLEEILTSNGVVDVDLLRQTLLQNILDQNRMIVEQNLNNQQPRARGINNIMNQINGRVAENLRVEENRNQVVTVCAQFLGVMEQAQLVQLKKDNENNEDLEFQNINQEQLDNIDPSLESFLRGLNNFCILRGLQKQDLSLTRTLHYYKFNWESFLSKKNSLDSLCTNLNEQVLDGKIDRIIGRDDEILMVAQILGKRKKANPVLVGKAGVGKTAIAEGLAYKIVNKEVVHTLEKAVIFALDTGSLVADTKFRGELEGKINNLVKELIKLKEKNDIEPILFIDEIHHTLASNQNGSDISNILKKHLSNGDIRCIGATTSDEWNKHIKNDPALKRRFSIVPVNEPTRDQTVNILWESKKYFEEKHEVEFTKSAIERCVDLSISHITDQFLPDKAVDLLDFTGSKSRIENLVEVSSEEVELALHRYKNIPLERIKLQSSELELKPLAPRVKEFVFGQDHLIEQICEVIEVSHSGMGEPNKPIASFLLVGPTGVGKTETAKQIASAMGVHFERIDMSEMMEPHSVSKLIGTSAGYIGYGDTPLLSKILSEKPHCVLLLDEIEKSHPDVKNIFLQAMDNGMIRDGQHQELSFQNVVLLMTSNAGATELQNGAIGMGSEESKHQVASHKSSKIIQSLFSPEFRGRLDGIVSFNPLDISQMGKIVDKKINKINDLSGLKTKNLTISIDDSVKEFLIKIGYKQNLGARPLETAIKHHLQKMISNELLYGKLRNLTNQNVLISFKDEKLFVKEVKSKKSLTKEDNSEDKKNISKKKKTRKKKED